MRMKMKIFWIMVWGVLQGLVMLTIGALLSGTILFWIWEPGMVPFIEQGITWIPPVLEWKEAVFLTWIFAILVKTSVVNK